MPFGATTAGGCAVKTPSAGIGVPGARTSTVARDVLSFLRPRNLKPVTPGVAPLGRARERDDGNTKGADPNGVGTVAAVGEGSDFPDEDVETDWVDRMAGLTLVNDPPEIESDELDRLSR